MNDVAHATIDAAPTPESEHRKWRFVPDFCRTRKFVIIAGLSSLIVALGLLIFLFRPRLDYVIDGVRPLDTDTSQAMVTMELLADARLRRARSMTVLTNGEQFYEAVLSDLSSARQSINLEAYIFNESQIGRRYVEVLAERAAAGVAVKVVLDAVGSVTLTDEFFDPITDAGGQLAWYHPPRWYTIDRLNNRTHRNLVIIDGRIGYLGGAGIDDRWIESVGDKPRWRDTLFRVTGDVVAGLQSVFLENWLEATGELLNPRRYFPTDEAQAGNMAALVVRSTPSAGGSTSARVLYQSLIASANERLYITNPYFIPDTSLRRALVDARIKRGIDIKILTPGRNSDQLLAQASSRARYGDLLEAGIEIYEYEPGMIHTKSMLVDDDWVIVGTTNFDSRSFGLNDEVNLIARNADMADHLERDFFTDLEHSRAVTFEQWRNRALWKRALERTGSLIVRLQ